MVKYSVIDLFSGAGGLSLGFMQTGKFDIKVAVETNPYARETYLKNHEDAEMLGDVREIDYEDILRKYGQFDVVIGGPPCQGFSQANRQKNHVISLNNRLVKEYVKAVRNLQPKVFVMENVDMLRSKKHRFYYAEGDQELIELLNIKLMDVRIELLPADITINVADDLVENFDKIMKFRWDEKTYLILNVLYKQKNNQQKFKKSVLRYIKELRKIYSKLTSTLAGNEEISKLNYALAEAINSCLEENATSTLSLIEKLEKPIYIQRMISKLQELQENKIIVEKFDTANGIYAHVKSYGVLDYIISVLGDEQNNYKIEAQVLNAADFGVPQKRMRFIIMGVKNMRDKHFKLPAGDFSRDAYRTVRDAIGDLEDIEPSYGVADLPIQISTVNFLPTSLAGTLRNTAVLYNHVITQNKQTALNRFAALAEGQNFHDLEPEMKEDTYTDSTRTQNTIYLRLKYDEPSGTVVNIRKSMWIHPTINRALSIREAARLQTFPDSFIFTGTKDAQYQQVGNAVPPILANAIAEKTLELLQE